MDVLQGGQERWLARYAIAIVVGCLGLGACSSPDRSQGQSSLGEGNSGEGGADGGTADPGSTASSGGSGSGIFGPLPTATAPSNNLADGACAATSHQAEQIVTEMTVEVPYTVEVQVPVTVEIQVPVTTVVNEPVAFYIMLDQSGSMNDQSGNTSKWTAAVGSLTTFVNDPLSDGLNVAFNTFASGIAFLDWNCSGSQYANSIVPMGRLPGNAPNVVNALNTLGPNGFGTNIQPGLHAAVDGCVAHQQATGERCIVIFVSDGQPNVCSNVISELSAISANAYTQHNVQTFAVAMAGSDFNLMNAIAQAGGTDCDPNGPNYACDIQQNASAFIDALNRIRQTSVVTEYITETRTEYMTEYHTETRTEVRQEVVQTPVLCEWEIPPPPDGETFDRHKVNVEFSAGGGQAQRIGYVATEADCAGAAGGWYYDDSANPTKILVCPQTCNVIQAITNTRIDILLGCETEPAIVQ